MLLKEYKNVLLRGKVDACHSNTALTTSTNRMTQTREKEQRRKTHCGSHICTGCFQTFTKKVKTLLFFNVIFHLLVH